MQIPAKGHAPFPVIIMNHGYFDREGYVPGDGTYRAAEYLSQHGYITLASDYRSWGKSDIGPSFFYTGLAIDVINLMNAVPSIPQADPSRIGIWGHSMGGGVTAKVIVVDLRIKAAVFYSTVSADDADLIASWGTGCIGDIHAGEVSPDCNSSDIVPLDLSSELIDAYRTASYDPDLLHQISPIYHLDLVTAPVEISYGTNDGLPWAARRRIGRRNCIRRSRTRARMPSSLRMKVNIIPSMAMPGWPSWIAQLNSSINMSRIQHNSGCYTLSKGWNGNVE